MSLIEKALQKMRTAGASAASPQPLSEYSNSNKSADAGAGGARRLPKQSIRIESETLEAAGVVAPPDRLHQQVSDYRHIKRQIVSTAGTLAANGAAAPRLIMLTSALPGEGKTFTAINLALSLALERDTSVLLIDGDIAKPNISRLFDIERRAGLIDALADDSADIEDFILGTNVRGLSVLSAGRSHATANEFLSSGRMDAVISKLLADRARFIVLDSSPLLVTTEAAALSRHAGQILVVVQADSTVQRAVHDALHLLGERDGISLILNRVKHTRLEGYYYGYGYRDRYGDQPVPAPVGRD
jgi:exopolysaccharide/PEP-CTERM locus tyrosine autokinase